MTIRDAVATDVNGAPTGEGITVYGATWCGDTKRSVALLDRLQVPYDFIDVDRSEEATAWVKAQNGGLRRLPTIVLGAGGPIVAEPDDAELLGLLRKADAVRSA